MKISKLTGSRGGRILLVAIPVGIATAVMMGGVANGAVPVSFAISGQQFKLTAGTLDGTNFSQYAGTATETDGTQNQVLIDNMDSATITDLCQSVVADTPVGKVGLLIHAGGGKTPVTATDLQLGITDLGADATFQNIEIGSDASTVGSDAKGTPGDFAMESKSVALKNVTSKAWSTSAGVFSLAGLHLQVTDGSTECY